MEQDRKRCLRMARWWSHGDWSVRHLWTKGTGGKGGGDAGSSGVGTMGGAPRPFPYLAFCFSLSHTHALNRQAFIALPDQLHKRSRGVQRNNPQPER